MYNLVNGTTMIFTFAEKSFDLNGKTELINDKGEIEYTCIYDFSYKKRIRILDKNNNEVAYIQFRALSSVNKIGLYDKQDKQLAYINLNETTIKDDNWSITDDNKIIDKDNNEVMSVTNDKTIINDDNDVLKCIMCLFILANRNELIA